MAKKKDAAKAVRAKKAPKAPSASAGRAAEMKGNADPQARAAAKAVGAKPSVPRKQAISTRSKVQASPAPGGVTAKVDFEPVLAELRDLKETVRKIAAPPSSGDAALEASVDSLRRLLSELVEQRMESVVRELAAVRQEAATVGARDLDRIVERLDQVLDRLGAVRFAAEPMDLVDPLIGTVVEERCDAAVPDGVVLETLRPGYRTARGLVVSKAAVAMNRRA